MTNSLEALIADMRAAAEKAKSDDWGYDVEEFHDIATHENILALIAALESRQLSVKLHKLSVNEIMQLSGFSRDYAEGWCAGNDNAIHEIRLAGGQVEGERWTVIKL